MANMSYCRFENTLHDLADCVNALDGVVYDGESISEREWKHAKRMKEWCERFIETFEDIDEEEVNIN
jgi:hypothetical protein